jgi:hypothetical protein
MANLAKVDLAMRGEEARLRALLEDLLPVYLRELYLPEDKLALAVWFGKSPKSQEHNLLVLFAGPSSDQIPPALPGDRRSLFWRSGSNEPPFVIPWSDSVNHFAQQLALSPQSLARFFDKPEVLYYDKELLNERILEAFNIIAEPSSLLKGWYVSAHEYEEAKAPKLRNLLARWSAVKPDIGLVKVEESQDFEHCRGLLHMEFSFGAGPRWMPLRPGALHSHSFYNDLQDERPGYLLFQGGSLYQILKVEVKTAPEYPKRFGLLEKLRDDRYPEVYLRAVHPPEQSAA